VIVTTVVLLLYSNDDEFGVIVVITFQRAEATLNSELDGKQSATVAVDYQVKVPYNILF